MFRSHPKEWDTKIELTRCGKCKWLTNCPHGNRLGDFVTSDFAVYCDKYVEATKQ